MTDLRIACTCRRLTGVARNVSARTGNRLVCYCDNCQQFAEYLGRAGEVLDAHGGTEVFQTSPARVEIIEGHEHLACVRLTRKGVLRWYADCCKTPIGNTLPTSQIPFVGLITFCLSSQGQPLPAVLGPIRGGVNGRYARGDKRELEAHDRTSFAVLVRVYRKLLGWRLRGDHRRTPFFDSAGVPVAKPVKAYDSEPF